MNFGKLLAGWGFRTETPAYDEGDELVAFVTAVGDDGAVVRVGDTVIRVPGETRDLVDTRVRLRVDAFDEATHEGRGTILDVLDTTG